MRKIQNNSLIRFFYGNLETLVKSPFPDPVLARPGDIIRTLVNKFELGSDDYTNLRPCLLPIEKIPTTPLADRVPVLNSIGSVRVQASEDYTHFRLRVDSFAKNQPRQFTLKVAAGQAIMAPFYYDGPSQADMMQELSEYFQSIPQTVVRTKTNGPVIDVWMLRKENFVLASDLTVELGEVRATNQNRPVLASVLLETYNKGASKDYDLTVMGTIIEGNIFSFNGLTYTAKKGATAQDIVNYFTGNKSINILDSTPYTATYSPGSILKKNSNIPQIYANLSTTSGGFDKYLIRLSGTYQAGNVLTVYTSGRNITHIVQPGQSNAAIEAILNPDTGGFFQVSNGTQVNVRAVPGESEVQNDNIVQFFLSPVATYPAQTIERYGVSVGSDVRKGNEYNIVDMANDYEMKVVATSSDTNFTIAQKLSGQPNPYFSFERVQNAAPVSISANPGYMYTEEDKLPVTVISQPTNIRPDQVVLEMIIPQTVDLPYGEYVLALRHAGQNKVIAISSAFDVSDHLYTSMVEVADKNQVFGYNYSEGGLTQRLRLAIGVKMETPVITENMGQTMTGVDRSISTKIDYVSPFSSDTMGLNLAKSLISIFKHGFLRIDDVVYNAEEPTYTVLSEFAKQVQMHGNLKHINDFMDNYDRLSYPRVFAGDNAIISAEFSYGLRLFLRNATFTKEVRAETVIPADGYCLEVVSEAPANGFVHILIRDQKEVLVELEVDKTLKHRSIPFRIQPNSKVIIELTEVAEINNSGFYPIRAVEVPVIWGSDIEPQIGSGFNDGFDEGYN